MMKSADQVFAAAMIYAHLAADGRIDHRQKRRGNLYIIHSAHKSGGGESGNIADHSPAKGENQIIPAGI